MPRFDIRPENSALILIDVQERFAPVIPAIAADQDVGRNLGILAQGAALLSVPIIISEQYVKGLGPTLPHLLAAAGAQAERFEKTHFSCFDDAALNSRLTALSRPNLIIAGIEAHICVLGTVSDALAKGYNVVVVADAVASRTVDRCANGLRAAADLGALVVPVESVLFRWQRQAGIDKFKAIAQLVK